MFKAKYFVAPAFLIAIVTLFINRTELSATQTLPFHLGETINLELYGKYEHIDIDSKLETEKAILFTPNDFKKHDFDAEHYIIGYKKDANPHFIMTSLKMDSIYECNAENHKLFQRIEAQSEYSFYYKDTNDENSIMISNSSESVYASCEKSSQNFDYYKQSVLYTQL